MQVLSASAVWISVGIEIFNLWLRMGLVYFLITQSVDNEAKVKGIAATIVLAIVYLSYYSISSFVVGYLPGVRAAGFGWYENPNDIAIILVTAIPLALLVANTAKAIELLGLWEKLCNPGFKPIEFERFRADMTN